MSKQHGKSTVFKVAANDLSQYTSASELTIGADSHDTTTYGNDAHRYTGGLLDSKFKASGIYDTTAATGPRAVLLALVGTTVSLTRQTEGTGTGKPQDVFAAVLTSYVESSPVADMVTWSSEWDVDGEVTPTTQV